MYAIRVNKDNKVNQVSSRTQPVRSDSNLIDFFTGDIMMRNMKGQFVKGNKSWMADKHHLEESKRKMSESHKGKCHSEESKRKMSKVRKGKPHFNFCSLESRKRISNAQKKRFKENPMTEETKQKISKANIGRVCSKEARENYSEAAKKRMGKKSSRWKGGTSLLPYPYNWHGIAKKIRERDNHICQLCSKIKQSNGKKLDVHHINYDKNNSNPKNLITLCCSCNIEANDDRKVWTRIFQNMIKRIYKGKTKF